MKPKHLLPIIVSIYKVTNVPRGISIHNGMTTPKNFHGVTAPAESLTEFIISDFLQIIESTKFFLTISLLTVVASFNSSRINNKY